ncbi:glycosyl hydrolase 115 family protein [Sphingomonas sp. CLY1604]|uniref:glycosyl hydrolase 115 family protein n=1 Tax=Sphingomonas sp. CLY1604 TaxID=3457786 RepID=UPI003FD7AA68
MTLKPYWVLAVAFLASEAHAERTALFSNGQVAAIVHEEERPLALAAQLLARDLTGLTGRSPDVSSDLSRCRRVCVVVARSNSPLARAVAGDAGVRLSDLSGQWERYERTLLRSRRDPAVSYVLISGSDTRGAIWGVIDVTREIGVSAWEWWADVKPRRVDHVEISGDHKLSTTPSVQYRGIFLNDEDWGLQPWAAKTYEPQVGDIGPKTYSRVFELMWRLKANTLWPAMHDSTKPFYQIKGNAETARDYAIVMSTSHAEPMMRNNVREWDEKQRGPFNFFTNRQRMVEYWAERAQEVKGFENIYAIGLRGKHDSKMEGADTTEKARDAMTEVMGIQRGLLAKAQKKPADQIPQALTLYKEVLDVYRAGLKVPDDVTLVWPEDNYGYINQLSTPEERRRRGGSGVYYHISYWGQPHDYLWLATTHPALLREQMDRAYQLDARKIWIVNVGDIKPGEYLTQYFLDLAFDHRSFEQSPRDHLKAWAADQFGPGAAEEVSAIMTEFYDLAFERRPEFMGGDLTEPIRPNVVSPYVRTGGDEAWRRLDRYVALTRRAEALARTMPADRRDAYFQLVLYPVRGAASLNERVLKLDLATTYAKAGRAPLNLAIRSESSPAAIAAEAPRADMNALVDQAKAAHARIVSDTAAYNAQNGGKWKGIMDMAPRRLPVFEEPAWPHWSLPKQGACGLDLSSLAFVEGRSSKQTFAVYSAGMPVSWHFVPGPGTKASVTNGELDEGNGFETRVTLSYDGRGPVRSGMVDCGGRKLSVDAQTSQSDTSLAPELNRIISVPAVQATSPRWEEVPGLGSRGSSLRVRLEQPQGMAATDAPLVYVVETGTRTDAVLRVVTVPVHPLTSATGLRLGVKVDDGPLHTLDFETFGRSEEWKRNVLTNAAYRDVALPQLSPGRHRIEVFARDPGLILDRLDLRLDGAADFYGGAMLPM